ncbi:MAG: hypothetical protein Q7V58_09605 [Actinomycetota bacterium]|nr:hypothetical protein [Actinomycetota bacterium]
MIALHCDGPGCEEFSFGLDVDNWIQVPCQAASPRVLHLCGWACVAAFAHTQATTVSGARP